MEIFAPAFVTFHEAAETVESVYILPAKVGGRRIPKMGRTALRHICIVLDQVPDRLQRGFKELPRTPNPSGESPNDLVTIGFFDDDGAWFVKTSRQEFDCDFVRIDEMVDFDELVAEARSMTSHPVEAGTAFAAWMTLKMFRERKYSEKPGQELVLKETSQLGSPLSPAVRNRRLSSGDGVVRGNPERFVSPSGLSEFSASPCSSVSTLFNLSGGMPGPSHEGQALLDGVVHGESVNGCGTHSGQSMSVATSPAPMGFSFLSPLGTLSDYSEPFEEGCASTPDDAAGVVEPSLAAAENMVEEESSASIVIPSWEPDVDDVEFSIADARRRLSSVIARTSSIFNVPPETNGGSLPGERRGSLAGLTEAPDFARLTTGRRVKSMPPTVAPMEPEVTASEVSDLMALLQRHVEGEILDTENGCRLIEALVYPVFEHCGHAITPKEHARHMALFVDVMDDRVAQDRWPSALPKWLVYATMLCHSAIDTYWRV